MMMLFHLDGRNILIEFPALLFPSLCRTKCNNLKTCCCCCWRMDGWMRRRRNLGAKSSLLGPSWWWWRSGNLRPCCRGSKNKYISTYFSCCFISVYFMKRRVNVWSKRLSARYERQSPEGPSLKAYPFSRPLRRHTHVVICTRDCSRCIAAASREHSLKYQKATTLYISREN